MSGTIDEQVAQLEAMAPIDLRSKWRTQTGDPAPRVSPKLLRLALAWEIQARAYGGLARETVRQLDQIAHGKTRTTPATPGTQLVRE